MFCSVIIRGRKAGVDSFTGGGRIDSGFVYITSLFNVVNFGGQDDDAITMINAQFVESDELSFEEQEKQIGEFPLPPSMIIKTRKSLHTYWFVKDAKVERFRIIQKQLVKQFHGDSNCVNESRVMRLPGV